jgi:integrase
MNINEYWNRPLPHSETRGEAPRTVLFQHPGSGAGSEPGSDAQLADMTMAEFVATRFLPDHIAIKTSPGKRHYQAILKHVLTPEEVETIFGGSGDSSRAKMHPKADWPYMSDVKLRETSPEHVQRLITAALNGGYSSQTIRHIRNVVGAVFSHALRTRHFSGDNPASLVVLPGMKRRESHCLTLEQTIKVLELMQYPEREVTLFVILTSMNIAEICGLQWKFVNLTEHHLSREGQSIPPRSILVRNQWYRGELCTVPAGRRKSIPIPQLLFTVLHTLSRTKSSGWNDFVLSTKSGRPINQINLAARRLKHIGRELEMPWISWQVLRRTRAVLAYEFGTQIQHELAKALPPASAGPVTVFGKIAEKKRG